MATLKTNTKVKVDRQVDAIDPTTGRRLISVVAVHASWPALVLGLHARAKNSLVGRVDGAAYTISWQNQTWKEGDLVTYAGKQYALREILDDTGTPTKYFTAYLQERNR